MVAQLKKDQAAATKTFNADTKALLKELTADAKASKSEADFIAGQFYDMFELTLQEYLDSAMYDSQSQLDYVSDIEDNIWTATMLASMKLDAEVEAETAEPDLIMSIQELLDQYIGDLFAQ